MAADPADSSESLETRVTRLELRVNHQMPYEASATSYALGLVHGDVREIRRRQDEDRLVLDSLTERMDSLAETVNSHTETLNSHTETLNSHTETLNSHTETLNSHTRRLDSMDAKLGTMDAKLDSMDAKLGSMDASLAEVLRRLPPAQA